MVPSRPTATVPSRTVTRVAVPDTLTLNAVPRTPSTADGVSIDSEDPLSCFTLTRMSPAVTRRPDVGPGADRHAFAAELGVGLHAHGDGVAELQLAVPVGAGLQHRARAHRVAGLGVDPRPVAGQLDPARDVHHHAFRGRWRGERPQRRGVRGTAAREEGRRDGGERGDEDGPDAHVRIIAEIRAARVAREQAAVDGGPGATLDWPVWQRFPTSGARSPRTSW